ncbi:MAG: hypothetical protein ACRDUA_17220 [Micromonosporaceae bacterium]
MAWAGSKIFRPFLSDAVLNIAAFDLDSDTFKCALFTNAITPDNDCTAADSAYNVAQWATANEVSEAGQWAQGGVALTTPTVNVGSADVVFWDAADVTSGAAADLADVHGCEVYDDTLVAPVADQGICYNYFGGANSVVNGTFTVVWSASGIWRVTL